MNENKSKVYVKIDEHNRITAIDGGYTISNITDFTKWVLIDKGVGDKYNLCQSNYLEKPLMDERGIYRYKLNKIVYYDNTVSFDDSEELETEYIDYEIEERTELEMELDYDEMNEIAEEPTQLDRVAAQALYTALMTDTLIEEGSGNV